VSEALRQQSPGQLGTPEIGTVQLHLLHQGKAEVGPLEVGLAQIGVLVEPGAEIGLHQASLPPATRGSHHPAQAAAMQQGPTEIRLLQAGPGEIRLVPLGPLGLHSGEIGAPQERLLETTALHLGTPQAGATEAGLLETASLKETTGEVEITAIQIGQLETGEAAFSRRQGSTETLQTGGLALGMSQPSLQIPEDQRMAARASSCRRREASSCFSAWASSLNTLRSITS
jgi:hypothetical protein